MRRAMFFLTCALCGMTLCCVAGLMVAWFSEAHVFVLPDAADLRVERPSFTRQRLAYHLPPNQTPNDLFRQLEQHGWRRDRSAEQALRRDRMEDLGDAYAVFRRHGWLGLTPEVATIVVSPSDARLAQITLARCFALMPWTGCL